jgi:glycosyltransferase involved in cell wall biosynthesis
MKLGIVIPWFGRDLTGGAEQQAWQIAARLAARGHDIDVLTTCCHSHQEDWATNHLAAGLSTEPEGFTIRRFPVDPRDRASFDRVCAGLLAMDAARLKQGVSPISEEDSKIFVHELIKSKGLIAYLSAHKTAYDWFLFLPYLYGPILEGIQIVGPRAALQPCLHDEAYAYLPQVAEAFRNAGQLLFNSEGEYELALRLFGPGIWTKSRVIGEGVEVTDVKHRRAPSRNGSTEQAPSSRYLLYLGRKDPGKNVPLLMEAFARFRAVRPNSTLGLVLAGHGSVPGWAASGAVDKGLVSDEEKEALLQHCVALVQPSQSESFSRVMMEAWFHGRPVAVHRRCAATAIPVRKTGGGWLADTEADWARLFVELDRASEEELRTRGENGRRHAEVAANWDAVIARYEEAFAPTNEVPSVSSSGSVGLSIDQFLPNLSYGDAISNQTMWIRDRLREAGYRSNIFVQFIDPKVADQCDLFTPEKLQRCDAAIYHHSIGSDITPHLLTFQGPKCLIYHNITPGEFFEPYRPAFARILNQGRSDLAALAKHFKHSVGVSAFNASELRDKGFRDPGILPLGVDPDKLAVPPDPMLMDQLQDGRTNILFVGRFAPNKKQDELIVAFSRYLEFDPDARLILAGKPEQADPYVTHIGETVAHLGLEGSVWLPGSISTAQLSAYYRTAHLFWSMSEHEGFCVPLVEAMWFDIPILAFKSSAVPETLGPAAMMFSDKSDLGAVAALARLLITDLELHEKVIQAQRSRRIEFLPEKVRPVLRQLIEKLVGTLKSPKSRRPAAPITVA